MECSLTYTSVDSGNRYERTRSAASAVGDVDLRTSDVELGALISARSMKSDLKWPACQLPIEIR